MGAYVGRGSDIVTIALDRTPETITTDSGEVTIRVTGPRMFIVTDEARDRYRILNNQSGQPAYLQGCSDGYTRYRNDAPPVAGLIDQGLGMFATATGETLDLRPAQPTLGNVKLSPQGIVSAKARQPSQRLTTSRHR